MFVTRMPRSAFTFFLCFILSFLLAAAAEAQRSPGQFDFVESPAEYADPPIREGTFDMITGERPAYREDPVKEMNELIQRAREFKRAGYPYPEYDNWPMYSDASLLEALERTRNIQDDCRAAVELKMFLDSRQDELSLSRSTLASFDVARKWLPNPSLSKIELGASVLKVEIDLLQINVWDDSKDFLALDFINVEVPVIEKAKKVTDSYNIVKSYLEGTEAGQAGRWALEIHEKSRDWDSREVSRQQRLMHDKSSQHLNNIQEITARFDVDVQRAYENYHENVDRFVRIYELELELIEIHSREIDVPGELDSELKRVHQEMNRLGYRPPQPPQSRTETGRKRANNLAEQKRDMAIKSEAQSLDRLLDKLANDYLRDVAEEERQIARLQVQRQTLEKYSRPLAEDMCQSIVMRDRGAGEVLDGSGATIVRAEPERVPGTPGEGRVIFSHSGSWAQAYGGWRTEENPPNAPYSVGPTYAGPGKYRVNLSYSPDVRPSMTAGNHNTGVTVRHKSQGSTSRVATLRPVARDKPSGKASTTFILRNPGQMEVFFAMATSRGQAGGYLEHQQSFSASIEYLEHLPEQRAVSGTCLWPGDRLKTSNRRALVNLWGAEMYVQENSEVKVAEAEDGTLQIHLIRGQVAFNRDGSLHRPFEVLRNDGSFRVVPEGTRFLVSNTGIEVMEGRVKVLTEDEIIALDAGQGLSNQQEGILALDPGEHESLTNFTSSDGISMDLDFWLPQREAYGKKQSGFINDELPGGWVLADPPARWSQRGREDLPRAGMSTPRPGKLQLDVPGNSRLDDRADTAPRLLHKITGDFVLEADADLQAIDSQEAALQFLVRSPGSSAGVMLEQFPRSLGDGPGEHYFLGGIGLLLDNEGNRRVQALNEDNRAGWPEVTEKSVRVRLIRSKNMWFSGWSVDKGETWHTSRVISMSLPETVWVGWCFLNPDGSPGSARFTLGDVLLESAPLGTLPLPQWQSYAQEGSVVLGNEARLVVDGEMPGTARAMATRPFHGDFDVEVAFELKTASPNEEGKVRWSLAAVDTREAGLAIGGELDSNGLRYGVVYGKDGGYKPDASMQYGSDAVRETSGKLRLVRTGEVISAYYWRGGEWNYFRSIDYREQKEGGLGGPLFLRLEATNDLNDDAFPALALNFSLDAIYLSPAERLREEGEELQVSGDYYGALEKYRQSLALKSDPLLEDRFKRLKNYVEVSGEIQNIAAKPGSEAEEAGSLVLNRPMRADFGRDDREHWFRVSTALPGSLQINVRSDETLNYNLALFDGNRVMDRDTGGLQSERAVKRPDLDAHEYLVRIYGARGDGPYIIEAVHEPQAHTVDQEPNDAAEDAQPIGINKVTEGVLGYVADGHTDTRDWFRLETRQHGALTVELEGEETLKARLSLLDGSGNRFLDRDNSGQESRRRVHRPDLAPGTYYIRIDRQSGYGGYTLSPRLEPALYPGDREPKDSQEEAQEIQVGKDSQGLLGYVADGHTDTRDWFRFEITEQGRIAVAVSAEESLTVNLRLTDASGTLLTRSSASNNPSVERDDLPPGTYFVRVQRVSGHGGYSIRPVFTPDSGGNDN